MSLSLIGTPPRGLVAALRLLLLALLSHALDAYAAPGVDWSQSANSPRFSGRAALGACVYNNQMWVVGGWESSGQRNDVWRSPDGMTWTQVTPAAAFPGRVWHQLVAFQGKMLLIGGYDLASQTMLRDIWASTDGILWTKLTGAAPFLPRTQFACLVYNNKIWVVGGWNNTRTLADVWWSSDGVNWTLATNAANIGTRAEHRMVSFNGKMWVSGGWSNDLPVGLYHDDVWSSTDGINWALEAASPGFSARWAHQMLVANTKMYVIGGCGGVEGTNLKNDVWSSSDGVAWTQETAGAAFSPRFQMCGLTFANRLWLLGGRIGTTLTMAADNVWYSDVPVPVDLSLFSAE